MARLTKAQKIEQDNELLALDFFEAALSGLPDPRRPQGVRYPLRSVVVIGLMATVCGCDDAEAMQLWGEHNAEWLAGFLDLPHGAPTQDVFLSVFGALDPEAFSAVFRSWAALLALRLRVEGKHIAVDGKTSRRSIDSETGRPTVHTVSAWMSEAGLVLGQRKTEEKSNEITAIPELLRLLDLSGATVTIDAIGCQTEIAKTIWVLDMAFREDEARHRARNTAQNMTTLRHFALNLVKADTTRKVGVATARKRAGWDRNSLIELLTSAE